MAARRLGDGVEAEVDDLERAVEERSRRASTVLIRATSSRTRGRSARGLRGRARGRRLDVDPGAAEDVLLPRASPAGRVGAADRGDDGERPRRRARRGAATTRRDELGRRVGVRAVAEHQVEEEDADRRVGAGRADQLAAHGLVDHRVRPADGVDVVARVDDEVPAAGSGAWAESVSAGTTVVDAVRREDAARLGGERAAAEEADEPDSAGGRGRVRRRSVGPSARPRRARPRRPPSVAAASAASSSEPA